MSVAFCFSDYLPPQAILYQTTQTVIIAQVAAVIVFLPPDKTALHVVGIRIYVLLGQSFLMSKCLQPQNVQAENFCRIILRDLQFTKGSYYSC